MRHGEQVLLFSTRKELALRISLLHLRHLLGESAAGSAVPHLLIQRDTLGLDFTSALDLDLHLLLEACTSARASSGTTLTMPEVARRSLLAQLQRATGLPRGEFLEGFSPRDAPAFDDWVRFQREYWHLRTSAVLRPGESTGAARWGGTGCRNER